LRFNALKILVATVYAILAAELLFRVLSPVPMTPRNVAAASYGVRSNMPNKEYVHTTAEYKIRIRTNSKGIRAEREIPYPKPPGVCRIVLLGDSFGMGYGVDDDDMFSSRMVYHLREKFGINAEVINLSTSGHGNAEELIALRHEGFKYDPDLVLLGWHYTDLDDNVRSNLFKLTESGTLTREAQEYLPGVKEREFLARFPIYEYLAEHSQLYNFTRNWVAVKVKRWLAKARFHTSPKAKESQKSSFQISKISGSKKRYKRQLSLAILSQIQLECRERGSEFLILDIPFRKSKIDFVSKFPLEGDYDSQYEFNIASPIEKFKEHEGALIYYEIDGHFTPLGCDLVGELLADFIYEKRLL
jgi:hypothetical protein